MYTEIVKLYSIRIGCLLYVFISSLIFCRVLITILLWIIFWPVFLIIHYNQKTHSNTEDKDNSRNEIHENSNRIHPSDIRYSLQQSPAAFLSGVDNELLANDGTASRRDIMIELQN